ncbi:MAG: hypothetical protein ACE5JX_22945 [Acidobacteriota bacterium]
MAPASSSDRFHLFLVLAFALLPLLMGGTSLNLSLYIEAHADRRLKRDLIACAGGGHPGFLGPTNQPVSVFFYPQPGARDFRYFETDSIEEDPQDLGRFHPVTMKHVPLFGGFLRRFATPNREREVWVRMTYLAGRELHMSGPIRLRIRSQPTRFAPAIVQITGPHPLFVWNDEGFAESAIYFQVISDGKGQVVSATYTHEKRFQFYDTSNVVINLRDVRPPPQLERGRTYTLTLMGVGRDNWVNWIARRSFSLSQMGP